MRGRSSDRAPRRDRRSRRPIVAALGLALLGAGLLAVPAGASSAQHDLTAQKVQRSSGNGSSWAPDPTVDTEPPSIPSSVPVATVQSWLAGALELRAEELSSLQTALTNASDLPDAVQSSLSEDLSTATTGIAGLTKGLPKDTTLSALRNDTAAMVGYRVLSVVEPQVHLVLEAERQLAVAVHIAHFEPALETAIKTEQSSKASSELADLDSSLSTVETNVSLVVPDLLSQSPADYKDAATAISSDQKTLQSGWSAIGAAKTDVSRIVSLLAGRS